MAHFSAHVDQTKLYTTERIPTFTFVADGPAATNKSLNGSQTQLANAKSSIPDNSNSLGMHIQQQQQRKESDSITTTRTVPPGALHIIPSWQPLDAKEKPPYSYATLIAHAILSSEHRRLTLCDIYQWITQHYPFYSMAEHGWQNSIRHNLSLNKSFIRIQRLSKTNSGKGSFWTIRAGQELGFIDNLIKRRGPIRKQPVNLPRTLQHRRSSHRLDDSSLPASTAHRPINNSHLFTTFRMAPTRSTSSAPLGRSPTHRKRSMPELNQLQQATSLAIEDGHESDCDSGVDFGYQKRCSYQSPLKKAKSTPCLYDDHLCNNDAAMMDYTFETLLSTTSSLSSSSSSSAEDLSNWTDLVTPPLFEWDPLFPTTLPSCMDMSYQHLLLEPTASFVHQPPPPPLPPTTTSTNGIVCHDYMLDDQLLMTGL